MSPPLIIGTLIPSNWEATLINLFNPIYLIKNSYPNTIILRVNAPTDEFGRYSSVHNSVERPLFLSKWKSKCYVYRIRAWIPNYGGLTWGWC